MVRGGLPDRDGHRPEGRLTVGQGGPHEEAHGSSLRQVIKLTVNGERREVWAPVHKTLLEVLREDLLLTGTKHGCELGECGSCAVLVDGQPRLSCLLLPIEVEERQILTVEGLATHGRPHPLQLAFAELGAAQCGYCTPGVLVTAKALLDADPTPDEKRIREALSGNLCRCTGYCKIVEAVELAAQRMQAGDPESEPARQRSADG